MAELLLRNYLSMFWTYLEEFQINGIIPVLLWTQATIFFCLFLLATVGKKFGIRTKYILLLDKIFLFAASKLKDESVDNTGNEDEEEEGEKEAEDEEEGVVISPEFPKIKRPPSHPGHFSFEDTIPYLTVGMRTIIEDCVSKSFSPAELCTWNMLSRTKKHRVATSSVRVTLLWGFGFLVRYILLVPVRLLILIASLTTMVVLTFLVGRLPEGKFKRQTNAFVLCWCFDFVANTLSVVARFHNRENRPTHGIAVANHTSPIDSMVLATDNCYDMVGQKSGGILGLIMDALSKSSTHIWFDRTDQKDRSNTLTKLYSHSQNKDLPPVLLYPEGICVNNTAVLLFRKGVFELDCEIHPIAIKFDPRYGDAFWFKDGFFLYYVSMLTSWAIVCDVWYLPPMKRKMDESPEHFANRVKSAIAKQGGLAEVNWDGFLKVMHKKPQVVHEKQKTWLKRQQSEFAKHLEQINIPSSL